MSLSAHRALPAVSLMGVGLVVIYTALISGADAITKLLAGGYAAPQLYAFSGLIVITLSLAASCAGAQPCGLRTCCPRAMALRSSATVVAAVAFFQAFHLLPFAEVFLFIGIMPIIAGLLSGPVLGEPVRASAWAALAAGGIGVACLFPTGPGAVQAGHLWALVAVLCGTFSMVMARFIGRFESNALAQVFYPNLALCVSMMLVLPFVWVPMPLADLGWVAVYAGLLFGARWVLVVALRHLAAYTVTPLMNLQFVWMVGIGAFGFGEMPAPTTILGATIIVASGGWLVWEQAFGPQAPRRRFT